MGRQIHQPTSRRPAVCRTPRGISQTQHSHIARAARVVNRCRGSSVRYPCEIAALYGTSFQPGNGCEIFRRTRGSPSLHRVDTRPAVNSYHIVARRARSPFSLILWNFVASSNGDGAVKSRVARQVLHLKSSSVIPTATAIAYTPLGTATYQKHERQALVAAGRWKPFDDRWITV